MYSSSDETLLFMEYLIRKGANVNDIDNVSERISGSLIELLIIVNTNLVILIFKKYLS